MRHLHDEIDAEGNVLLEGAPYRGDEPALGRAAPRAEGRLETPQEHQPRPGAHASAGEVRPGRRLGSAARGGISAEPGAAEGLEPAEEQIAVDARAPSAGSRAGTAQRSAVREGADPQRAFIEPRHCVGEAAGLTARISRGRDTAELVRRAHVSVGSESALSLARRQANSILQTAQRARIRAGAEDLERGAPRAERETGGSP